MTTPSPELDQLINKLLDATISEGERQRLGALLRDSESGRELYLDYVDVHLGVVEQSEFEHDRRRAMDSRVPDFNDLVATPGPQVPARPAVFTTWRLLASALTIAATVALAFVWLDRGGGDEATVARVESNGPSETQMLTSYVAEIGAVSSDVKWGEDSADQEFFLRVRPGDRLDIEEGLVRLSYYSGANLILRGPCSFTATGVESGTLHRGELTGRAENCTFALATPKAQVLDLGTEFGVTVDRLLNTDVCVFEGKVKLTAGQHDATDNKSLLMTVGMAARATSDGQIATNVEIDADRFARSIPLPPSLIETGRLSLVDVVNGYEKEGYRLAIGIAPDTGEAYQQSWLASHRAYPRQRRGVYHATNWHPMVDGVFIPAPSGINSQVDSSGGSTTLPNSGAKTSGPIWSRRRVSSDSKIVFHENFWGGLTLNRVLQRLQHCEWGMIGLHANVGITFDLKAIREQFGKTPARFVSQVTNLDNSDQHTAGDGTTEKRFVADFRLFVDGELRASRFGFGRTDGDMRIDTPLDPSDRFLTIVTTDAGHYWYDQVALIDPVLELTEE